jgi:hypothetical protein
MSCRNFLNDVKVAGRLQRLKKFLEKNVEKLYRKETLKSKGIMMIQNVLVEPIRLLLNMLSRTFSYTKANSKISTDSTDRFKG